MSYCYNLPLLFREIASRHGSRPALWLDPRTIVTYQELDRLSDRLAGALQQRYEIGLDSIVCIAADKSTWCYASLLAVLKTGAAYVMLDPDSPTDRLDRIFGTCRPRLVLGPEEFLARLSKAPVTTGIATAVHRSLAEDRVSEFTGFPSDLTGENPAYIMYTSGSTGIPKGAVMTHSNVLNFVDWARTTYNITPDDIQTNLNPVYFDNSVFDIYSSLFTGASLVPFTKSETKDPGVLVSKLDAIGCTSWFSVPSLLIFLQTMRATDGKRLRSLRRIIFGGEGYPKGKLVHLYERYKNTAEFHNVYGPTECTCICSSYRLSDSDFVRLEGLPPLGHLAPNFSGLVIDDAGNMLPDGNEGELCLLGPNVGKGYYNDPERTAAAFTPNPNRKAFHETMYRTGDLARRDPSDGMFHILGRKDNQIKHMGHRIELEEIESALHRIAGVEQAAVVHTISTGTSRIIAAVAVSRQLEESMLREELRKLVPDYMMPSSIQFVAQLPKNANGKVDRKQVLSNLLSCDSEPK